MPTIEVRRISRDGLGFGGGNISCDSHDLEILNLVDETINHNPDILVAVDKLDDGTPLRDDGCGDGREAIEVATKECKYKRSLNRSKVFGGAVTMTMAIKIGTGRAEDKSLQVVFKESLHELAAVGLSYGAHTDENESENKCGCGAIDLAPEAVDAALKYEKPIRDVITGFDIDEDVIDKVYENYREYVNNVSSRADAYNGKEVMDEIVDSSPEVVVKRLGGEHRESRIVLNEVEGYTVNQKLIRDVTNNEAQVFAVDTWRLAEIAETMANGDSEVAQQALASELVYTLAIAAVLTKGDLPVDMIQTAPTPLAA